MIISQEIDNKNINNDNSTIETKLNGIAGVSRKVKLKRMLLIKNSISSSSSSSGLSGKSENCQKSSELQKQLNENLITPTNENNKNSSLNIVNKTNDSQTNNNRLFNVKLKPNNLINPTSHNNSAKLLLNCSSQQQQQYQPTANNNSNNIKWPPAPSITKAVSEPNFGIVLRSSPNNNVIDEIQLKNNFSDGIVSNATSNHNDYGKMQINIDDKVEKIDKNEASNVNIRDESQQQLLSQCLSQLKLRHEEITLKCQINTINNNENSKVQDNLINVKQLDNNNNNFDSMQQSNSHLFTNFIQHKHHKSIQLQSNAGDFLVKPSIIKLQQQQKQNSDFISNQNNLSKLNKKTIDNHIKNQINIEAKNTTTNDSIGSAGSLAQRNSQKCSTKQPGSPSSSQSCVPSYGSSIEVSELKTNNDRINDENSEFYRYKTNTKKRIPISKAQIELKDTNLIDYSINNNNLNIDRKDKVETIDNFLVENGLIELSEVFAKEKIDLEALVLLSEDDLKSLNILLGPRRKLFKAIENRRQKSITKPMYVVVDTIL